jgi:Putative DNA-binding domain
MKLLELQRRMAADVMRPLTGSDHIAPKTSAVYVKPNDRLTSLERLEIYNRQYWFRVIDSMYEDFAGLCAVIGQRSFDKLAKAYVSECPSQTFTLRNLGSQIEDWLRRNPGYAGSKLAIALDMARLEWAHIEAYDGEAATALGPEDLIELGPGLRLGLQPYIGLLELQYPVDDLRISVNAVSEDHGTTSNAVLKRKERGVVRKFTRLRPERIFLAVHRLDFSVYYRRITLEEFRLLEAIRQGMSIGAAVEASIEDSSIPLEELRAKLETWFRTWAELGWLCRPRKK